MLPAPGISDKILHGLVYAILGFFTAWALDMKRPRKQALIRAALAVGIVFLFGVSDEIHQMFVAGRVASFADVVADGIGGALGALLAMKLSPYS
jgi:VanZ family protein